MSDASNSQPSELHPALISRREQVVLVAIAGADVQAIAGLIRDLPVDQGMAFIVGSTSHELELEQLRCLTSMIVVEARQGSPLQPNHVYVMPPGRLLSCREHDIRVVEGDTKALPIDHLLRSLAEHHAERSAAVLLSGVGSDGSMGAAEMRAAGSLVILQAPANAAEAALSERQLLAKAADLVLPLQRVLGTIVDYFRPTRQQSDIRSLAPVAGDVLGPVLAALNESTGHDFSRYKRSTVSRRIERRMRVHGLGEASDYVDLLQARPHEAELLASEMLIGVTSFFRDPEMYGVLASALDDYLEHLPPNQDLRVWVPACATGEEAYSIAILLHECVRRIDASHTVKLFATDVDAKAIEVARCGRYPLGIAADVSPERLERFFVREDDTYRVNKEMREQIVFAPHNVTRDPPFTHIDLLSCRNLLIYLEPELQQQVLQLFEYALEPRGLLLIGGSESLGTMQSAFEIVDKKAKLFAHRAGHSRRAVALPIDPTWDDRTARREDRFIVRAGMRHSATSIAEQALMAEFVPPSAIVAPSGELAYIYGRTGRFLEPAVGEPSTNIFEMAREGLRLELPAAVRSAHYGRQTVVRRGLSVRTNGSFESVTLTVKPLEEPETLRGLLLVTFDADNRAGDGLPVPQAEPSANFEGELNYARTTLQGMIEELESSNEELKSINEELRATNEAVQSSNDVLSASREELRALNEELQALNEELEQRNSLLAQTNDDIQDLVSATVFVDTELNVRRFTAPAKKVFRLRDTDVGRPVSDLVVNLDYQTLGEDAVEVMRTLVFAEREVQTMSGEWRLIRILPNRTAGNVIDGLMITVTDIERLKRVQREKEEARSLFDDVLANMPLPLVLLDPEFEIVAVSVEFARKFGATVPNLIGKPLSALSAGWRHPGVTKMLHDLSRGEPCPLFRLKGSFGSAFPVDVLVQPRRLHDGHPSARYLFLFQDIGGQLPSPINVD